MGTLDDFPPDRRKEAVKAIEDVENEVNHKHLTIPTIVMVCTSCNPPFKVSIVGLPVRNCTQFHLLTLINSLTLLLLMQALPRMQVMPGLQELCQILDAAKIPRCTSMGTLCQEVAQFHRPGIQLLLLYRASATFKDPSKGLAGFCKMSYFFQGSWKDFVLTC